MPVSPELAANLAKETLQLYIDAEQRLLARIADRLAEDGDAPNWMERKLAQVQRLRAEAEAELERLTGEAATVVDDAVRTAYNRGTATAGADLTAAGTAEGLAFGRVNTYAVDALPQAAIDRVTATHLRVLRSTLDSYLTAVYEAGSQVTLGAATRREASRDALVRLARRGITGFVDSAGRSWDLATYAEMAVRTQTAQAAVQGHLNRLGELGHDLVIVSDAPEECPICRPWEGKVLSISGRTSGKLTDGQSVAGTVAQATGDGLFHPNCRHSTGVYIPGVTRPLKGTADPVNAELRAEQRQLERQVRSAKRDTAVNRSFRETVAGEQGGKLPASDPIEAGYRQAREREKAAKDRLAGFIAEHDRKDLRYRTALPAR